MTNKNIFLMILLMSCGKNGFKAPETEDLREKTPKEEDIAEQDASFEHGSEDAILKRDSHALAPPRLEVSGSAEERIRREEQVITLAYVGEPKRINYVQVPDLDAKSETFTQGSFGRSEDIFTQSQVSNKVDILLVVDNSGSMKEEQINLAEKLEPLLNSIKDSDWKIGITTTDLRGQDRLAGTVDDCMEKIIAKDTPNAPEVFRDTIISLGLAGSGDERGLEAAVAGLKGECANGKDFLRKDSHIAVIIISDENNCSTGAACPNAPKELTDTLSILRPESGKEVARVYAIVGEKSPTPAGCKYAHGSLYLEVANNSKFAGFSGDVCSEDYTPVLEKISLHIKAILEKKFVLTKAPYDSPKVFVNKILQDKSVYSYMKAENLIVFNTEPPSESTIKISYKYLTPEMVSSITIKEVPTPDSLDVFLQEEKMSTTEYSFEPELKRITFTHMPPEKAVINVKYKIIGDLPASHDLTDLEPVYADSLHISVAGSELQKEDYTLAPDGKIITFAKAPDEGSEIVMTYQAIPDGLKLSYEIDTKKFNERDRLKFIDKSTNEEIKIDNFEFPHLLIPVEIFAEGKDIIVSNY